MTEMTDVPEVVTEVPSEEGVELILPVATEVTTVPETVEVVPEASPVEVVESLQVVETTSSVPFEVTEAAKPAATIVIGGRILPAGTGEYLDYRQRILEVRDEMETNQLALSELLHQVQKESLFVSFGYPSFQEFIEKEVQIGIKHASNLVQTWDYFGKLCVEAQTIIKKLGPTKAQHLVGHLTNENFVELEPWLRSNPTVQEIALKFKPDSKLAKGSGTKNEDGTVRVSFNLLPEEKDVISKGVAVEREGGAVAEGTALARIVARDQINTGMKAPIAMLQDALMLNTKVGEDQLVELLFQCLNKRVLVLNDAGEITAGLQYLDAEGNPIAVG
jgi:hypothetical protein